MKKALGEVMLAIRTDLLKGSEIKSNLTPGEFKMYSLKKDKKTALKLLMLFFAF